MKCIDQMPMPIAVAPPHSQSRADLPRAVTMRPAMSSAVYEARIATKNDAATSSGLKVLMYTVDRRPLMIPPERESANGEEQGDDRDAEARVPAGCGVREAYGVRARRDLDGAKRIVTGEDRCR